MTQADEPRRESLFGLGRRLVGGFVQLARLEITRGRQEIGEMIAETTGAAVMIGIGAGLGLLALITLDLAIVLGITALFEALPPIVVVIIIVVAFVAVAVGFAVAGVVNAGVIIGLVVAAVVFAVPAYLGFSAAWLWALFVLTVQAALALIFVLRGVRHIRIGPPEETIAAMKEDVAWAKRLLKRG
ncbi:MAG TPA: phage holin family protein [Candidatus Limnocylindria bacterium]|nr:phage holin family protein [Candidatus Limnocylindria bacterium]